MPLATEYVTGSGFPKVFNLWFDKTPYYFALTASAYPSDSRLTVPAEELREARAVFSVINLDSDEIHL